MSNKHVTVIHRKDKEVVLSNREIIELYVTAPTDKICREIITYALTKEPKSFLFSKSTC